jgi:hypothetical protein
MPWEDVYESVSSDPPAPTVRRGSLQRKPYVAQGPDDVVTTADFTNAFKQGAANVGAQVGPVAGGVVRGATMNLVDPASIVDRFTPGETLSLAKIMARNRAARESGPGSTLSSLGELAGSVGTGVMALPKLTAKLAPKAAAWMGGVPMAAGEQAVQGGVSAYAGDPNTTVGDAAQSAVVQGGLTGLLGTAGKTVSAGLNKVAEKAVDTAVFKPGKAAEGFKTSLNDSGKAMLAAPAVKEYASSTLPGASQLSVNMVNHIKDGIVSGTVGAAGGYFVNLLTGEQLSPIQAMAGGATAGASLGLRAGANEIADVLLQKAALNSSKWAGKVLPVARGAGSAGGTATRNTVGPTPVATETPPWEDQYEK